MPAPSRIHEHLASYARDAERGAFDVHAHAANEGISASGAKQRINKFRAAGWIDDDGAITPKGRSVLSSDGPPASSPASSARGAVAGTRRARERPETAFAPGDLRWLLAARVEDIATIRRTHGTNWGPGFLAEMVRRPELASTKTRKSHPPKPSDLLRLLDLPKGLVLAALRVLQLPAGARQLERIEQEPARGAVADGPALPAPESDREGAGTTVEDQEDEEVELPAPTATGMLEPAVAAERHFLVVDRKGAERSAHGDLPTAKRAMQRDARGWRVVRLVDNKVMCKKERR
jgi:hypothetical protein